MEITETNIAGVKIIQPKVYGDSRGFFMETFELKRYQAALGRDVNFVQDNYSRSSQGVLRGLHFQRRQPQGKLVSCIRGEVFDVAVDIRPDSATFGQWHGILLSEHNKTQFYIPPGLAHGFVVLSEQADFVYKCTDYYAPSDEACLIWNDPDIGIEWPIKMKPVLSNKDSAGLTLQALLNHQQA